jgi:hypothetical protein
MGEKKNLISFALAPTTLFTSTQQIKCAVRNCHPFVAFSFVGGSALCHQPKNEKEEKKAASSIFNTI